MSKIVFTDFFGVVVHDSGNEWLKANHLFEHKQRLFPRGDIGELSEEQLMDELSKLSGIPAKDIFDKFEDLAVLNKKTVAQFREIKKSAKIVVLSNCYDKALERRLKRFHLEDIFDDIIISYQIGMIKPHKDIYEYAYKKHCHPDDEIFYIDDQAANLIAPKELGWKTIKFDDNTDLINFVNKK